MASAATHTVAWPWRDPLRTLARVIYAYPTQGEAIRKAADAYNRTRLTPTIRSLLRRWLQW